jgi:hypothetical protein
LAGADRAVPDTVYHRRHTGELSAYRAASSKAL